MPNISIVSKLLNVSGEYKELHLIMLMKIVINIMIIIIVTMIMIVIMIITMIVTMIIIVIMIIIMIIIIIIIIIIINNSMILILLLVPVDLCRFAYLPQFYSCHHEE